MPVNQFYIDNATEQVEEFCNLHNSTLVMVATKNGEQWEENPKADYTISNPVNGIYKLLFEYHFSDTYNLTIVKDKQTLATCEQVYFETLGDYIEEMTRSNPFKNS
jgi:hypothetical protein